MKLRLLLLSVLSVLFASAQSNKTTLPGAYQTNAYLPLLRGKKVAVVTNHTAFIKNTHLVDSLLRLGIDIQKIFAPEHGFRGKADAGERVENKMDSHIPIISLFGRKTKPQEKELLGIDVLLFDIQDVGVRFYTYISTLQGVIESAIQYNKPMIILDRPNPNGFYVDGPVLEPALASFVGMQPIPIVYGMTIGEYAKMLLGEKMLEWKYIRKEDKQTSLGELLGFEHEHHNFSLTVIPCINYTHSTRYQLPIPPSPNLPDMSSVYWYPSTCLFEGTTLSEGRGTPHPFCYIGHPSLPTHLFSFTPTPREGAKDPKWKDSICYGFNVLTLQKQTTKTPVNHLQLDYLLQAWQLFPDKNNFFIKPTKQNDYFFNKLAGNTKLMEQIKAGTSINDIRASWQPQLIAFKKIRKKYLLYPDF